MNDKENNRPINWDPESLDIGFDDITFPDPDRIFNLIRLSPYLDRDFSEYCSSRKISRPDLNSVCKWVGEGIVSWKRAEDEDLEPLHVSPVQAVAEILSAVIRSNEGICFLEPGSDMSGGASLAAEPLYPWYMNEKDKRVTREEVVKIIEKYMKVVTDDKVDFNRYKRGKFHSKEFVDGVEGIGLCLDDVRVYGAEQVVDLIRQAPAVYESFLQYCSAHGIHTVSMLDFAGWIGCEQINYAVAEILCRVIAEKENIFFVSASVQVTDTGEISTFVVLEEKYPWEYSDREKALTVEECQSLLENYTAIISDDAPFFGLIDFTKYGY